jgi:CBS domain-containing protein
VTVIKNLQLQIIFEEPSMKKHRRRERSLEVITPDSTIYDAVNKMKDLNARLLPVFEESRTVGILSSRDIAIYLEVWDTDPRQTLIRTLMNRMN